MFAIKTINICKTEAGIYATPYWTWQEACGQFSTVARVRLCLCVSGIVVVLTSRQWKTDRTPPVTSSMEWRIYLLRDKYGLEEPSIACYKHPIIENSAVVHGRSGVQFNEVSCIGKATTVKRGTSASSKVGLIAARRTGKIRGGKKDNSKGDD
ncbi:60S ribosomal protein L8 [Homalodisca vitripennis]|nr:60S ribosomal protein L8 [Homalodisca vitripennis]